MADNELFALQLPPSQAVPPQATTATSMVLPPVRAADRLRHFSEEIYDTRAESHLSRFVKVLIGDAGAGQVRKRLTFARLRATLQGSHFFDLDKFYGPLFGIRRTAEELLALDPHEGLATADQWQNEMSKDASFRSRIEQLARALVYGPTPTGMELIAEAILAVDCDVFESFIQADESYQTYGELEDQYGLGTPGGFYSDMEDISYSELEGASLARISGDERRIFTVRPKRAITQSEAFDLRRVLNRIKPVDSRLVIESSGVALHEPVSIVEVVADSEHWEVISEVGTSDASSIYPIQSVTPVEQPRPPFSGYQGEAWSYNADMVGVSAYSLDMDGAPAILATERMTYVDGSTKDFPADQAILPSRMVQAGRVISDAVLVSHPYTLAEAPLGTEGLYEDLYLIPRNAGPTGLYTDGGMSVTDLANLLSRDLEPDPYQLNPASRYWVSPPRPMWDLHDEVIEVRFASERLINYLTFEVAHYPQRIVVEVYSNSEWVEVLASDVIDSIPKIIPDLAQQERTGHPLHSAPGHWLKVSTRIEQTSGSRVRIKMVRWPSAGNPIGPTRRTRDAAGRVIVEQVPYSLALRSLDVGYRVYSKADFGEVASGEVISSTRDITGALVNFRRRDLIAQSLTAEGGGTWVSEPQPVNYAVVNLYVDTRTPDDDGTIVDRWYLHPTHIGAHFTIYYSNDPAESGSNSSFFEDLSWTPIPRDFVLQKGYVHIPPTRARYWKFEFTNLSAEQYECFVPISRKVKFFPRALVEAMHRSYQSASDEVPAEWLPLMDAVRESRYSDALTSLGLLDTRNNPRQSYLPTEALYFPDLNDQQRTRDASWVYGFTPWQQGGAAPAFSVKGRHVYEETQVPHSTKVAFFVGLKEIRAYRTNWADNDDTAVYFDTYDDFRNLTPGFTWTFEPGYMRSGTAPAGEVSATSRILPSRHNVEAIQFATVQSPPIQLVPDHDFRDPALATYDWTNIDSWIKVGDAQTIYSPSDRTVINVRRVVPVNQTVTLNHTVVNPVVHPVQSYLTYEVPDETSVADSVGGLATPVMGLSDEGWAYAAVRFTSMTNLTSPLYLQIIDTADDSVLIEREITAQAGQTVEDYLSYEISDANLAVRARLVQRGKSDDAWRVHSLALFEDSIIWEFSVNGGSDWFPAQTIRNNDRGVLTFAEPGNQLRYRVRTSRTNQWVSAVKIRPWYVGRKNARSSGTQRGPNVSVYDSDLPIHEDPMFTSWKKPIPQWWYLRSQRFDLLPVEGAPTVTEYARFYGRPVSETLTEPSDSASAWVLHRRGIEERMDFFNPISDISTRIGNFSRDSADTAPADDAATSRIAFFISKPVHNSIVQSVFSQRPVG